VGSAPAGFETVLDCAAVDRNASPDFAAARAAGAAGIYLRKCEHTTPDRFYELEAQRARDAGLVVGAYCLPRFSIQTERPRVQVAAFKAAPGDVLRSKDFAPALDIECPGGGFRKLGRPLRDIFEDIRQCVLEVEAQFGCSPVIYTSFNQWYDLGLPAAPWAARCPLWIKTAYRLSAGKSVDSVAPPEPHLGHAEKDDPRGYYRIPDPWANSGWWLQQYQGDAVGFPGFSRTVDISRFQFARQGDEGVQVSWLARKLVHLPAPLRGPLDPSPGFGSDMTLTVEALQREHGIKPTGTVDLRTFAVVSWT
jgi:hypothetical protein